MAEMVDYHFGFKRLSAGVVGLRLSVHLAARFRAGAVQFGPRGGEPGPAPARHARWRGRNRRYFRHIRFADHRFPGIVAVPDNAWPNFLAVSTRNRRWRAAQRRLEPAVGRNPIWCNRISLQP